MPTVSVTDIATCKDLHLVTGRQVMNIMIAIANSAPQPLNLGKNEIAGMLLSNC